MAGDKKLYETALRKGLNLAWEGEWAKALEAYEEALAEMPGDPVVHSHLGLAYFELRRFEPALEAYTQASRLAPGDPAPLARIAEIHERLGQRHAAADALFSMAELHQDQRNWKQAIQAIQHAIRLYPEHLQARMVLAELYVQLDRPQRAIREYLSLARAFQQQGEVAKALDQCRQAVEIDPRNPEVRALAQALQRGEPVQEIEVAPLQLGEGASPVDLARDRALEELASIPFEDRLVGPVSDAAALEPGAPPAKDPAKSTLSRSQIDAQVARAIDFQTRGMIDDAIACYTRVIDAGVDRPAAHFSLGLLHQQRLRFEPAIAEFQKALQDQQYALGSHFALGECHKALGRIDDALEHLIQVLKIVDLGTVQEEQAGDLIDLYDALSASYIAKEDAEKALAFADSLIDFLSSEGWEDRAHEARQRLDSMSEEGVTMSLAEFLAAPSASTVLASMSLSQEYAKERAYTAAAEVCYDAIEVVPTHLPLHLRLAEIFTQSERIEDAVAKYQMVANLYLVREETRKAIGVHKQILRLKPMDVVVRSRLIDLLITSGEIDEALEQYMTLANAYYELAQANKALEKCAEALRLVRRASNEVEWRVRLLHNMVDIHLSRAGWREAAELCQQILALVPDDDRAHLNLIDLNYKLGRVKVADRETLAMLEQYRGQGEDERALVLLQEAVRLQPQQMRLRARMARAYIDAGMHDEAIHELDTLGELQLDAGLRQQAMATVRFIISLNPRNVDAYRKLLAQL